MIYQTEETRNHILRVAETLFLERGFFDTQMKHVAEAVGMSRNTLYRYYRDKTDLGFATLEMVLRRVLNDFSDAITKARQANYPNRREMLAAVLREIILSQDHDVEMRFTAEFDAYFSGSRIPENFVNRQDLSAWEPVGEALGQIIVEGIEEGSIRKDFSPQLLLQVILTAVKMMQQEVLIRQTALSGPAEQMTETLVTLLMDGLKPAGK